MKNKSGEKTDERKSVLLFLLVFFIASIATIVLGILCLGNVQIPTIKRYFLPLAWGICLLVAGLCGVCVWATISKRSVIAKSLLSAYVLLLFCLVVCLILQKTGFFAVIKTAESLQLYLEKAGAWMPVFYVILQFLQVVVLPIPSVVSTVAGVALFGAFRAMIYSLLGIVLGSFVAFFIGRKLGYRAVSWMVGEDTLNKWQKKLKGKDNLFLTLMFILPLFPDDILCLLAGLSSMTTKYFVAVILLSRLSAIATTCYLVDFIPFTTWWGVTIWTVFFVAMILVFVILYKNLDRLQKYFKSKGRK